jgi:hypothetical protein
VLELPKPPWYRRVWTLNLAVAAVVVVLLVAATTLLGSRGEPAAGPTTVTGAVAPTVEEGAIQLWSFDRRSFRPYGGGNFKVTNEGDFAGVSVQGFAVKGTGNRRLTHGGRLVIESVCDRWTVKAVAP